MTLSKWQIINGWLTQLNLEHHLSSSSLSELTALDMVNLIQSSFEGNIYCDTKNFTTVLCICLMIKHFSILNRKIICDIPSKKHILLIEQLGLTQYFDFTSSHNQFKYLFHFFDSN